MFSTEKIREAISKYLPFRAFILLVYVISFACILLWLVALPLIFLYDAVLCVIAWSVLPGGGKDVIVVSDGKPNDFFDKEVIPMVRNRAFFLNYEERKSWPRRSLPVLLFRAFGPSPIPPSFLPRCLPAVVLVRRFKLPSQFSFGPLIQDKETKTQNLRLKLGESKLD
jgi:hypothetical protein